MTGIVSQIITLTAYGNQYLKKGILPEGFEKENTAFRFCKTIDFKQVEKQGVGAPPLVVRWAENPTEWFQYLKMGGCQHLRLYFRIADDNGIAPGHQLAAFVGGGGDWYIEAVYNGYSDFWGNRWQVSQNSEAENRWDVSYGQVLTKVPVCNIQVDNNKVKGMLQQTLTEISAFANKENQGGWGELFKNALEVLNSNTPLELCYTKDMVPQDNYSLTAQQLLFSAERAWVFGGMGSWNDLWFDEPESQKEYSRLSAQLYSDINMAVIAATNTY